MAGETKMIIITTNEDLIRQLMLSKTTNTRIIDLDNDEQVTAMSQEENNTLNLAFLTELSELNSRCDQIQKRAIDSSHHNRSKQVKLSRKSLDSICVICGDRAVGFNYDVLSCASCKAFFRRNAYQSPEKLKCLTGHDQCSVAHEVHRKCARCRLTRCFTLGMRKDFLLSDEEKQRRKQRLEENRSISSKRSSTSDSTHSSEPLSNSETLDEIDQLLMDINKDDILLRNTTDFNQMEGILFDTLSVEDWLTIESVRSSFLSSFQRNESSQHCAIDVSDRTSALLSWSTFANGIAHNFIEFFRHIDEFESLHNDDRFILIKYNLLPLFPISKSYSYQPTNDCFSLDNNEIAEGHRRFFLLCGDAIGIREALIHLVVSLVDLTRQDPTLLALLLATLIFSHGLSMNIDEPLLKDTLAAHRAQNHYAKVLWNYLVSRQGEVGACQYFTQITNIIIQIQTTAKSFREFLHAQIMMSNIVDQMAPLMQTVLHIS